ncbi:MAG: hypothetical protein FWC30_01885 [Candidatus Bathyarchaeota archaeon]|nr:hypothetical protein [Candidatus Termiticorpusculum sp.]
MKTKINKKLCTVTILAILLCTSSIGTVVNAFEIPEKIETPKDVDPAKVLSFLRDIFQINIDKYDITLMPLSTIRWNDVAATEGQYYLVYSDYDNNEGSSSLKVNFSFWNSELVGCDIQRTNYDDGIIHYTQKQDGDVRKTVTGFLQRYQAHTKDEQIIQMINLLNIADLINGYTKTNNNLQFKVQIFDENRYYLVWSNTVNGADYSKLTLSFKNGELANFFDDRAFYVLGSDVVNVSKEQAISIALEHAASLSYTVDGEVISGFNIVNEQIRIQPSRLSRPAESLLVKYPIWIVELPLADIYPGMVSVISVMLWADTGEVISVQPLGAGFPNDSMDDSADGSSSLPDSGLSSDDNNIPLTVYLAGACIAIIIPIAIVIVVFKRRNKQK